MPFRQFVWRRNATSGINLTKCAIGTFDVVNISSIRFPKLTIFEDNFILNREGRGQRTVHLDVSDLDGNDLKIKNSDDCVFVEGKREEFDGRSWIQNQICRRLPVPLGYKVKSVRSKRLGYGILTLTVDIKGIGEADEEPSTVTKTVLICEGVLQEAITSTGPIKIALAKIQPKIINCVLSKPPRLVRISSQPSHQVEDLDEPVAQNLPSTSGTKSSSQVKSGLSYSNKNLVEVHTTRKSDVEMGKVETPPELLSSDDEETDLKQLADSESDDNEEITDTELQMNCRQPTFDYQIGPSYFTKKILGMYQEAFPRKFAENESDEHEEPTDAELLTTGYRRPTIAPKTVLASVARDEVKINLDWVEEKRSVSKYFKRVY